MFCTSNDVSGSSIYVEKNGEYEYSIFRWIQVHQFSIVPAVGSVWLFN